MKNPFSTAANPVLVKEMRGRMRGARAYIFLTFILLLLGAISYGLYRLGALAVQSSNNPSMIGVAIGQTLFVGLIYLDLLIICTITPALTAGAISGEHERRTFDLVAATPLHPASILLGKLGAALAYVALLILATVPFLSLAYLFGGVVLIDLIQALGLLLGVALTLCLIGLFFSTLLRRTGPAIAASYVVLTLLVFGDWVLYIVIAMISRRQPPNWILALNPFSALASALVTLADVAPAGFFSSSSVLMPLLWVLSGGATDSFSMANVRVRPLWQYTVGVYAVLGIALYLLSLPWLQPVRRWRAPARTWVIILALCLALPMIYGPLQPQRLWAALRWATMPARELLRNGTFAAPLETAWSAAIVAGVRTEPTQVSQLREADRAFIRVRAAGASNAETQVAQTLDATLPSETGVQVRARVRIHKQDGTRCGEQGDQCPLMLTVNFSDEKNVKHNWVQGFYSAPGNGWEYCRNCESRQTHIRVTPGEWYTFESANLGDAFAAPFAPRVIHSLTFSIKGRTAEVDVAEISVLARDGHPLNLRDRLNLLATPTPSAGFFPGGF